MYCIFLYIYIENNEFHSAFFSIYFNKRVKCNEFEWIINYFTIYMQQFAERHFLILILGNYSMSINIGLLSSNQRFVIDTFIFVLQAGVKNKSLLPLDFALIADFYYGIDLCQWWTMLVCRKCCVVSVMLQSGWAMMSSMAMMNLM